jgi:CHASE3 domain sensor protein
MKNLLIIVLAFFVATSVFYLGKQKSHQNMHLHNQQIGHKSLNGR